MTLENECCARTQQRRRVKTQHLVVGSEQTHHPVCSETAQDKQGEFPRDTLVVGINEVERQLYLYVQAA